MSGMPVTIVASGGWPVTVSESTVGGLPMTEVASGGWPVTVVASGGFPVSGIATGIGTLANVTCISAADDDEPDFEFDLPGSATVGMVIAAEYSVANADSWSSYFDHTLTAPEITADIFTVFGVTTLAQGLWDFRFRLEDGAEFGAWTVIQDVPINFAPTITTLLPADGASSVAVDANLAITFNKNIQFGTGTINIYKTSDDTLFESFDVVIDAGTKLTIAGSALTINPSGTLAGSTAYYVQVDAIAVQNTDGVSFAGIADETTYNFTTVGAVGEFELKVDTFYSDGTWTAPANIRSNQARYVELWAAGGSSTINAGSGGGGAYSRGENVAATPSTGYAVVVGVGAAASNGTNSTFASTTVVAEGGKSQGNGASGGLAANGTGTTKYSGGNGNVATGNQNGGTAAGSDGAGVNIGTYGGVPDGGGQPAAAGAGQAYGCGGRSSAAAGGAGGKGHARVSYEVPAVASYPYVVGRKGWRTSGAAATTHTITYPTVNGGIQAGDLCLLIAGNVWSSTQTMTVPGFSEIDSDVNSTNFQSKLYTKTAAGGEDGTAVTLTTSAVAGCAGIVLVIRHAGAPGSTNFTGSAATPFPPAHNAGSVANRLWLSIAVCADDGANRASPPTAASSGFNNIYIQPGGNGGCSHVQVCELRDTVASKTPGAHTMVTTEQYIVFTVAIPYA